MTGPELREMFQAHGMSYSDVAFRFAVKERTVFGWYANKGDIPLMLEFAARHVCSQKAPRTIEDEQI